jgi:hypothetical protein
MPLSKEQRRVLNKILSVGQRRGATRKQLKAAVEMGLTESNLTNPAHGDGTSVGWRQEIDAYGSVQRRRNVRGAARRFFNEAKSADRPGLTPGQLAQAVQRSAYPGRYDQRSAEADRLLRRTGGSGGGGRTRTIGGVDRSTARSQALISYLYGPDTPSSAVRFAQATREAQDTSARKVHVGGGAPKLGKGGGNIVGLGKLAQSEGLHVGENPHFGGVHPVHAKNSYHYQGRAIDVSGSPEQMSHFAHVIAKRYGSRVKELFWQGQGGVNIKNGKRVPQGFVTGHKDHVHVAL